MKIIKQIHKTKFQEGIHMRKKTPITIMTGILSLALLSGCVGNGTKTGQSAGEVTTPLNVSTAAPEEITLPIESNHSELSIALSSPAPMGKSSYNEIPLFEEYEKRTNIKPVFQHVTTEKMNLLLASNNLPDIFINTWSDGQEKKAYNDGQILRLDDLMGKYAPNYVNILKQDPELHAQAVDADGFLYSFQFLRNDPELRVFSGFMIRQDWLDKLNLKMPTNADELYHVLKTIKNSDMNGNGVADEVPFIMENGNALPLVSSWWGISTFYIDDNNTLQSGWLQPEYKEMLQYLNKLYNEGLLDPDYAITERNQFDTKISNGQAAMWYGLAGGGLARISTLMQPLDPEFKISALPWLAMSNGKKYSTNLEYATPLSGRFGLSVTSNCKNPIAAVKFADYAYSEEGGTLLSFGVENESYTMVNGTPTYTDLITNTPGKSMSEMLAQYTVATAYPMVQSMDYFNQFMLPAQKAAINVWKDCDTTRTVPVLKFHDEELNTAITTFNEVDSYNNEMINKFITGRESFDNYDNYQKTLKSMGLEDVVKVRQAAYERYLKNVADAKK